MTDLAGLKIKQIYGPCPVQAVGTIDGMPFYFRARGEQWSFGVGPRPIGNPDWIHYVEHEHLLVFNVYNRRVA